MNKKGADILTAAGWVLGVLGIASWLYYIVIVLYAGFQTDFGWFWLLAGLALMMGRVLCRFLAAGRIRIPLPVFVTVCTVFAAGVLLFMLLFGMILAEGRRKPAGEADYIIILGARVRGAEITRSLRYRLDTAAEYLREHEKTYAVCSGGRGAGEDISEAEAMQDYLLQLGISEERIYMEGQSVNTEENIRFSSALLPDGEKNVLIATNRFHIFRSVRIARKHGFSHAEGLGAPCDRILCLNYYVREVFAVVKDFLAGNL